MLFFYVLSWSITRKFYPINVDQSVKEIVTGK